MTSKQSVPSLGAVGMVQELVEEVGARPGLALGQAFAQARGRMAARTSRPGVDGALEDLALTLIQHTDPPEAGLYGDVFLAMSGALQGAQNLNRENFGEALTAALAAVQTVGDTSPARQHLIGTLIPAREAYREAATAGEPFSVCLERMVESVHRDGAASADALPPLVLQTMARFIQGALT
ncbi:DAK2 domain-containing protein [Deinococcus humi]|uniref:Dihydroxyacetone kinase n=1 Tax=Deinococcus humi TaxID=662880 RepID=A0A7W8JR09_9DEIO|nr:DAK2 domain-containing protein [Deinococcus humi]MBB5361632.1 dihydroxyacetone kinase [Deinococcus humi]GGO21048.1 hypothetical protein GCM10008949_06880 [Deinococcus humi]